MKIGRNEPCPCGSGKKYKKCCIVLAEGANGPFAASRAIPLGNDLYSITLPMPGTGDHADCPVCRATTPEEMERLIATLYGDHSPGR